MDKAKDILMIIGILLLVCSFLMFMFIGVFYMGQGEESIPRIIKVILASMAFTGTMLFIIPLRIMACNIKQEDK